MFVRRFLYKVPILRSSQLCTELLNFVNILFAVAMSLRESTLCEQLHIDHSVCAP